MFARGKYAYGSCDRCSTRWPINDLKFEVENGLVTKRRTCPDCYDPDHPQNFIGRVRIRDPQSIKDARPEVGVENSRGLFGWNPVGHELTDVVISIGNVNVTVS